MEIGEESLIGSRKIGRGMERARKSGGTVAT